MASYSYWLIQYSHRFAAGHSGHKILPLPRCQEFDSSTCRSHNNHRQRPQTANKRGYLPCMLLLTIEINKQSAFKPFRTVDYDTLKIYVKAHEFKVPYFAVHC